MFNYKAPQQRLTAHWRLAQISSGVFTAIVRKYQELGDWSPLKERDEKIVNQRILIDLCLDLLSAGFTEHYAVACDKGELHQLKQIGELATQLGVPPPDPPGSKFPLR